MTTIQVCALAFEAELGMARGGSNIRLGNTQVEVPAGSGWFVGARGNLLGNSLELAT